MGKVTRYPVYATSEVAWMRELPAHWKMQRGKTLFTKMERPVRSSDEVITCFRDGQVTLRRNRRMTGFTEAVQEHGYQGIRRGDLIIHAMDAFAGAIGVSDSDGKGTPVYAVCAPKRHANSYYYAHVLRHMAQSGWVQALSKGIRERSTDFRFATFANQFLPVPPPDEQSAIVRYLDHVISKVDRLIRAELGVVRLLRERRERVTTDAILGASTSEPQKKIEGFSSTLSVPASWRVLRAKDIWSEVDVRSQAGEEELLSVSHLTGVTRRSEKNITMFKAASYIGSKLCEPGDLVINTMWAWMGALGVAREPGIVSPSYGVYRPRMASLVHPSYIERLLRTPPFIVEYNFRSRGITKSRLRLYPEIFLKLMVPLPSIQEQLEIVNLLDQRTAGIDQSISAKMKEIGLLREYRASLITAAVSGRVDVRGVAARLKTLNQTDDMVEEPVEEEFEEEDA